jgi:Protein of unknown function (DUF1573)
MPLPTRTLPSIALLFCATASSPLVAADSPHAVFSETTFQFERVLAGAVVEHDFALKNAGSAPLRIIGVQMTSPLIVTSMPASVAPGTEARIRIRLDTSGLRGHFPGEIQVSLNDPNFPEANFGFEGDIVPSIEVSPAPVFFLAGRRGELRQASIEIINHEPEPLRIDELHHPSDRFSTKLETLEEGRRYRLTLFLRPDGPGGRHSDSIVLTTSSGSQPALTIVANTFLRERVYTFPDAVDFGTIRLSDIDQDPQLLQRTAQTLMVYQFGGAAFNVILRTDLPQLAFRSERGPQGDRFQNTLTLIQQELMPGVIQGSIFVETNDKEFPSLVVPVSGDVVP